MLSVIAAILAIGLLIVVHEGGHYFVAKWCKMRVDRFSIGFGPAILKWRRGETDFTIGPIPFGGFVQINGMTIADEVDKDDPRAYPNRPVSQRFLTIFAGPATNYLFAIVLALALYSIAGVGTGTSWFTVLSVSDGFDAQGKLQPGDKILALNGEPVFSTYEGKLQRALGDFVQETKDKPIALTVLRNGEEVTVEIIPRLDEENAEKDKPARYLLGILLSSEEERIRVGPLQTVGHAFYYPLAQTKMIISGLVDVISGEKEGKLTGPVGITNMIRQSFDYGLIRVIEFLMMLNVALGLFNLFPIPALDGGRLVFLGYEMATRRRANPKVEATVHMVGIMALLLLMVLVTYKDIVDLF